MSTDYKLFEQGIIRLADGAFIPATEDNRDYRDYLHWVEKGGVVAPQHSLEEAQALKLTELDAACAAAILAGFNADALGQPHHYPAKLTDQSNLQAALLTSLQPSLAPDWTTPVWCQAARGDWGYHDHTAVQIQQVGKAAKQAVDACISRKIELARQVAQATTLDAVTAIAW